MVFGYQSLDCKRISSFHPTQLLLGEKADEITGFSLVFAPDMDIVENETLTLTLPNFTHQAGWSQITCEVNCSASFQYFRSFSWLSSESSCISDDVGVDAFAISANCTTPSDVKVKHDRFVMTARSTIAAGRRMNVSFGRDLGVAIPPEGVRLNQAALMIGCDARAGPVLPTQIRSTQPVGSFTDFTEISFSPERAGQVSNISILLRPEMDLRSGDTIWVLLEDFTASSRLVVAVITTPRALLGSVIWNQSSYILSMPLASNVSKFTHVNILILEAAGIALPERGIRHDSRGLQIKADAQLGPVPWTSFAKFPPVGTFLNTSTLRFGSGAVAGLPCNLSFIARPVMPLLAGESVVLYLPGFVGENASYEMPISGGVFSLARWKATPSMFTAVNSSEVQSVPTLSIMLGNATQADVDFEFLLPCSFGLRLPLDGIRANQSSLKASPSASRGKITPTSIATTQAVGSFVDTPTIFCAGNAGEPANISIWLASEMQLMVADTISFRLPAFRKLVRVHGMTAPTNSKLLADSAFQYFRRL